MSTKPNKATNAIMQVKDTLTNFVANMNTGKDKRSNTGFQKKKVRFDKETLVALYREDWIAGKIIDIIADEMTREWRTFNDEHLTPEDTDKLNDLETELCVKYKFNEAKKWARLYGGALIVMNIEGTGEPHEPLDLNKVKEGSLKGLVVFDKEHASYQGLNQTDPFADNFRMPEYYRLSSTAVKIHHSRVLRFDGQLLPYDELKVNEFWSDSILNRIYEALINTNLANDSTAGLLFESNVDVVKVKNLFSMLSTTEGTEALQDRFFLAKMLKSNNNVTLIDSEEDIQKIQNTFAGIPDVMKVFMQIVSASADIPATRLFGVSPEGMNATGDNDTLNFYDHIREKQMFEFTPILTKFDQVLARSAGVNPDHTDWKFNPLWQLSDKEQADTKLVNAQADQIYIDLGVVKVSTVAKELQENDTYSNLTSEDIEVIEEFEEEETKRVKELEQTNNMEGLENENGNLPSNEGDDINKQNNEDLEEDENEGAE